MVSPLADEIDVLVKARREIGGSYVPSEDEEYMNERQRDYFRKLLNGWKRRAAPIHGPVSPLTRGGGWHLFPPAHRPSTSTVMTAMATIYLPIRWLP